MSTDLTPWVNKRLEADHKLSDDAKLLILAALEGGTALADMAGYAPPAAITDVVDGVEPAGAFLKQIKVHGFRGIGPESQLDLDPFPSLTVISGRNGSGKSSFAEALELALTGTTYRWHARTSQWKDCWRNMHDSDPTRIEVTLAAEGVGSTRLTAEWPRGAELGGMVTSLQRHGERKEAGIAGLGWAGPLETYRPILTYEELGALLTAEPKILYDAISTVLGLQQLTDAVRALDEHRKSLVGPGIGLKSDAKEIVDILVGVTDERAAEAAELMTAKTLDTAKLRRISTGTESSRGEGAQVRALLSLTLPTHTDCQTLAEELVASVGHLAAVGDTIGEVLERRSALITAAISIHEHGGDQICPVCEAGTLSAARVSALRTELEEHARELNRLQEARSRSSNALRSARSAVNSSPPALEADIPAVLSGLVAELKRAWAEWSAAPAEPLALAEHLTSKCSAARQALAELKSSAEDYIQTLDEAWSKVATRLAAHADAADNWEDQKKSASSAASAHKWLKENEVILKNQRVKPIADEAKKIWSDLRQESNVEIAGVTLESTNTRRHVVIAAEIEGVDTGALAVMSQGELHSLALALFLPRATMAESPFRFVVLDDPVQAMDPAKVDGLVKVLLNIAKTRQVIVFSHDDRFASAVRRAPRDVPVKVLEVVREANSRVTPVITYSPADRYLRDAFGLVKDTGLPDETRRRILPGLLRMALEAQARDTYFARELSRGTSHEVVEKRWEGSPRTRERIALAIDDPSKIQAWLDRATYRRWALAKCNTIHFRLEHGDMVDACRDVEKTLADIKLGAK